MQLTPTAVRAAESRKENMYEKLTEELRQCFVGMLPQYIRRAHARRDDKIKPDGTPVGNLDVFTAERLRTLIVSEFSGERIIGEEDQRSDDDIAQLLANREECQWTVDGLDGTGNRSLGTFSFGAMVAQRRGDEILFAAIFVPTKEREEGNGFLCAIRGTGAWQWCGDHQEYERLRTARHGALERITVMLEGSSKKLFEPPISNLGLVITTRSGFSTSVATTAVAEGKASAFVNTDHKPWDAWPAMLVIEEAGGIVTDHQGNSVTPDRCGNIIAAANPEDHGTIVNILCRN